MKTEKNIYVAIMVIYAAILVSLVIVMYGVFKSEPAVLPVVLKGAPQGLYSVLAVATTTTVGPQEKKTVFTRNTSCVTRVLSTAGQAIMVLYGDPTNGDLASTTITSMAGHWQGASTTVAYDAGIYGCGRMIVLGVAASTTITATEFR
ncbi:MAG: hypothetical protein UT43_C0005G0010 [Parcubacteria group bacterium GW2011_GWC1_39_29]|nr:MAG: hypothetical protein UT43_C0005G0010 [Parcubacteria group bacterium GW2011_GWC1_39_29]